MGVPVSAVGVYISLGDQKEAVFVSGNEIDHLIGLVKCNRINSLPSIRHDKSSPKGE